MTVGEHFREAIGAVRRVGREARSGDMAVRLKVSHSLYQSKNKKETFFSVLFKKNVLHVLFDLRFSG